MGSEVKYRTARRNIALFALGLAAMPTFAEQNPKQAGELTVDQLAKRVAAVQEEVEELRGWKFKHPVKVGIFTQDQLRTFMRSDTIDEGGVWGEVARSDKAKRMIGLIPQDDDSSSSFAEAMSGYCPGVYDHTNKTFYVVAENATSIDSLSGSAIVIHELVHALDDQHIGFDKVRESAPSTSDTEAVIGTLFEGSAIVVQERHRGKAQLADDYDPVADQPGGRFDSKELCFVKTPSGPRRSPRERL